MNLYEINDAIEALIDPDTGELLDIEAFGALQMERDRKIENLACYIKNLVAEAQAIQEEITTFTERKDKLLKKARNLEAYLARFLNGEKFRSARCMVSFRRSKALEVSDTMDLVGWCRETGHEDCIVQQPPEVSKKAITDLIKAGIEVPYARIIENVNMGVK